jgi:hypothetical protein
LRIDCASARSLANFIKDLSFDLFSLVFDELLIDPITELYLTVVYLPEGFGLHFLQLLLKTVLCQHHCFCLGAILPALRLLELLQLSLHGLHPLSYLLPGTCLGLLQPTLHVAQLVRQHSKHISKLPQTNTELSTTIPKLTLILFALRAHW